MADNGQDIASAAEVYEDFFVPTLFQEWAPRVVDAARIQPGQRVIDVACGTGVLTRLVAQRVGSGGSVVGLDINEEMLAVAERKAPAIEWQRGPAEALPFDDGSFDAVVSQFGLMFFQDRRAALQEMARVLRPGGRLAVAVLDSLDNTPGYAVLVSLLRRLCGEQTAEIVRFPFNLGDVQELHALFADAGMPHAKVNTHHGTARFPSVESWVYSELKGWSLTDTIDEAQYQLLFKEAQQALRRFVTAQGVVAFAAPAHIVTATK